MALEKLIDTQEKLDQLMTILNKPENVLVKDAFWKLWDDRNTVLKEWSKLYELTRNGNTIQ
jgi:hypothetical protein